MNKKYILGTVLVVLCFFDSIVATGFLFNALKNTVQNTRCKLHNIGSKIIQHNHHQGDPCASAEVANEANSNYGNNDFGTQNGAQINGNFDHQSQNSYGCSHSHQCLPDKTCFNNKCVDPCSGVCGFNAECQTKDHRPVCTCAPDFTGNPYTECVMLTSVIDSQGSTEGSTNRNEIKKGSSQEAGSNSDSTNGYDDINKNIKDVFGYPGNENESFNDGSKKSTSTPTHETIKFEESKDEDGSVNVTSDNNPIVFEIDVRASADGDSLQSETTRIYAEVPREGGRNIIRANCPDGKTATNDGQCLEEI